MWYRIEVTGEFLRTSQQTSGFHIRRGISVLAERLSAFQEVLYFMGGSTVVKVLCYKSEGRCFDPS